ncbi:MAG: molybdopterin cofactor-binding domain-containing protein [Phenylobacterium sp.]|nr:molybdopterin cofactor-binding domain-containing protein [Phenylobacterium sp.]
MNAPVFRRAASAGEGVSRRQLIITATAVGGALMVGCSPTDLLAAGAEGETGPFGAFVKIAPDGAVTLVCKHIEFGQGTHAGLAAIVAEELDADWSKVAWEHAPANAKLYANGGLGAQLTGGSTAINNSWDQLRQAGAAARAMFVQAAANR